jgi:urease accessory protein
MRKYSRTLLTFALATAAVSAHAHPFHGTGADFSAGIAHPFYGLDHLLAAVAVGIWVTRLGGRALWVVPLAFVGGIFAGSVAGLAISVTAVELLVAASVVALGALILTQRKPALALSAGIAATFAVFHGMAHTADVANIGWLFVGGLALGTAVCHAAAMAGALAMPKAARVAGMAIALVGCYLLAGAVI